MPAAATPVQAAADALLDLQDHLARYRDPAKLARHLRSAPHGWDIHYSWEDDLAALALAHENAHDGDLLAARTALADAEDAAADQGHGDGCGCPGCYAGRDR